MMSHASGRRVFNDAEIEFPGEQFLLISSFQIIIFNPKSLMKLALFSFVNDIVITVTLLAVFLYSLRDVEGMSCQ